MKRNGRFVLSILCLMLLLSLSGCGVGAKKESEIEEDLGNYVYQEQGYSVEEMTISKRQTEPEENTDIVYVTADVKSDMLQGKASYIVKYSLYNEGWLLEDISRDTSGIWELHPLAEPDFSLVEEKMRQKDSDFSFLNKSIDLENGICTYYFETVFDYPNAECVDSWSCICTFDKTAGEWLIGEISRDERKVVWDIEGTWYADEGFYMSSWYEDYAVDITNVDGANAHVKVYHVSDGTVYADTDVKLDDSKGVEVDAGCVTDWKMDTLVISINKEKVYGWSGSMMSTRGGCPYSRK